MSMDEERMEQLEMFYEKRDKTKIKNVEPLFENFSFEEIMEAVLEKYNAVPPEWEENEKRKSNRRSLVSRMGSFVKPRATKTKPKPPTLPTNLSVEKIDALQNSELSPRQKPTLRKQLSKPMPPAPLRKGSSKAVLKKQMSKPLPPTPMKKQASGHKTAAKPAIPRQRPMSTVAKPVIPRGKPPPPKREERQERKRETKADVVPFSVKNAAPTASKSPQEDGLEVLDASHPDMNKYTRMQKAGLPQGAVENAMVRDGVHPSSLYGDDCVTMGPASSSPASSSPASTQKPAAKPSSPSKPSKPQAPKKSFTSPVFQKNGKGKPVRATSPGKKDPRDRASMAVQSGGVAAKQKLLAGIFGGGGGGGGGSNLKSNASSSKPPAKKWPTVDVNGPGTISPSDTAAAASALASALNPRAQQSQFSMQQSQSAVRKPSTKPSPPKQQQAGEEEEEAKWVEMFSDEYKTPYWYNLITGESTWELPHGAKAYSPAQIEEMNRKKKDANQAKERSPRKVTEEAKLVFAQALYDFTPAGTNPDEIAMDAGLRVQVLEQADDGWTTCVTQDGRYGLVPTSYIQIQ